MKIAIIESNLGEGQAGNLKQFLKDDTSTQ